MLPFEKNINDKAKKIPSLSSLTIELLGQTMHYGRAYSRVGKYFADYYEFFAYFYRDVTHMKGIKISFITTEKTPIM